MKTIQTSFFLILYFLSIGVHSIKLNDIPRIPFLQKCVELNNHAQIVDHYQREIEFLFGIQTRNYNSILQILTEIKEFKPESLRPLQNFENKQSINAHLRNFISYNKILDHGSLHDLKTVIRDIFVSVVAKNNLDNFDFNAYVQEDEVTKIVCDLLQDKTIVFTNDNQKREYVQKISKLIQAHFSERKERYEHFVEFWSNPDGSVLSLLKPLIAYYTGIDESENGAEIANKLTELLEFLVQKYGFKIVHDLSQDVMFFVKANQHNSDSLSRLILTSFMKIFTRARSNEDMKIGKLTFLSYFANTDIFENFPTEYKDFLVKKYKREKLKFEVNDITTGYPELLRLYTIDVVQVSFEVERQFITPSDMRFIFVNFDYFLSPFTWELIPYMKMMREMFFKNKNHLFDYYELFNGLYDAMLLSGPYYARYLLPINWNKPGDLFDYFLDRLLNWENSYVKNVWGWQPSSKHFAIRIKANYFFYKLVNFNTNYHEMKNKRMKFLNIQNDDDFLINKFTLIPEYKELVANLKKQLPEIKDKGYNYKIFSNLHLKPTHFQGLDDHFTIARRIETFKNESE